MQGAAAGAAEGDLQTVAATWLLHSVIHIEVEAGAMPHHRRALRVSLAPPRANWGSGAGGAGSVGLARSRARRRVGREPDYWPLQAPQFRGPLTRFRASRREGDQDRRVSEGAGIDAAQMRPSSATLHLLLCLRVVNRFRLMQQLPAAWNRCRRRAHLRLAPPRGRQRG